METPYTKNEWKIGVTKKNGINICTFILISYIGTLFFDVIQREEQHTDQVKRLLYTGYPFYYRNSYYSLMVKNTSLRRFALVHRTKVKKQ